MKYAAAFGLGLLAGAVVLLVYLSKPEEVQGSWSEPEDGLPTSVRVLL